LTTVPIPHRGSRKKKKGLRVNDDPENNRGEKGTEGKKELLREEKKRRVNLT